MITINDGWDEGNFNNVYPKFIEPTQAEMDENVAKFHKGLNPVLSQAKGVDNQVERKITMNTIKVNLFYGSSAYLCIKSDTRNMDVLLSAGHSANDSLITTIADIRADAQKLMDRADFIEAGRLALLGE